MSLSEALVAAFDALPKANERETVYCSIRGDHLRELHTAIADCWPYLNDNETPAQRIEHLREWAKLAFRVINHVGPLMLTLESETSAEQEMTDRLREMAEAVAMQYMPIAGVHYAAAMDDARDAFGEV